MVSQRAVHPGVSDPKAFVGTGDPLLAVFRVRRGSRIQSTRRTSDLELSS